MCVCVCVCVCEHMYMCITSLHGFIQGFMKQMKRGDLPDALKGREKLIFGNIQAVYDFHSK